MAGGSSTHLNQRLDPYVPARMLLGVNDLRVSIGPGQRPGCEVHSGSPLPSIGRRVHRSASVSRKVGGASVGWGVAAKPWAAALFPGSEGSRAKVRGARRIRAVVKESVR